MFAVDDQLFTESDYYHYEHQLNKHPIWQKADKWRIAVCPEDIGKWIMLLLYLKKKEASVVPIHPSTPITAAERIAEQAGCYYLFYHSFEAPITLSNPQSNIQPGLVQFSSGTTGEPKQIKRSWVSIDEEIAAYSIQFKDVEVDTIIVACPVTHSYGLISGVLAGFAQNKHVLIVTTQNPKYVLKKAKEHSKYLLYAAPPLLYTLARFIKGEERLYGVMTSGTRLSDTWFKTIRASSVFLMQQYGCSEIGCMSVTQSLSHPDQMGKTLSHLSITAGQSKNKPAEIAVIKGARSMATGDLGYFNNEGVLCFLERIGDMINVAGLNVYPHEVEQVLCQHNEVSEAVVYKKVDTFAGERVYAQVVADEQILSVDGLRSWCIEYLAPHQIPQQFTIVDAIQKGANGKINRKQLGEVAE
ncbi:AMP-binding protein [Shouchella patagoniensis]|uniref:AMP-binding protein n=1 Tax=Shouchella patagoniensis TaxID=228576 RepID=UPI000994A330|nr:AMP-binding protein [Shouchella patagoniensis]